MIEPGRSIFLSCKGPAPTHALRAEWALGVGHNAAPVWTRYQSSDDSRTHRSNRAALSVMGWDLYEQPNDAWYRIGELEVGRREFLVQDPDGYLLRFAEDLGRRPPRRT
jgi:hypothetical protein